MVLAADSPSSPWVVGVTSVPDEAASAWAQIDWDTVLLLLWAATTSVLLLLYAAAWLRLSRLAKRWPRAESDGMAVVIADDVGPAVVGILRPLVVLPRWLMSSADAVRNTVVAHEREHIAARDQAFIVASQLVTVLLPWNLPLWWFATRLRSAIEVDCDARVLRSGVDPAHYADVLLAVGQRRVPAPYAAAALIEPITKLERRVRIILAQRPRSGTRAAAAAFLIVALAACATRLEPPALTAAEWAPLGDCASAESRIVSQSASTNRIVLGESERITLYSPQIRLELEDCGQVQGSAPRFRVSAEQVSVVEGDVETLSLAGNVRLAYERTSITGSRARIEKAPGGRSIVTIDDATVILDPPPTTSGE
jgi:hypothetical protein